MLWYTPLHLIKNEYAIILFQTKNKQLRKSKIIILPDLIYLLYVYFPKIMFSNSKMYRHSQFVSVIILH